MKKVWIVQDACFGSGPVWDVESAHTTKALAEKHCRNDGYKWSTFEDAFINHNERMVRQVSCFEVK